MCVCFQVVLPHKKKKKLLLSLSDEKYLFIYFHSAVRNYNWRIKGVFSKGSSPLRSQELLCRKSLSTGQYSFLCFYFLFWEVWWPLLPRAPRHLSSVPHHAALSAASEASSQALLASILHHGLLSTETAFYICFTDLYRT